MPVKEQVLVFPADIIEWGGGFEASPLMTDKESIQAYLGEILQQENLLYIDRDQAENDPDYLQIIPYTVIWRGREVFRYLRTKKGGEARLHDKWSIGVGGHINHADGQAGKESFDVAFWRELAEEVSIRMPSPEMSPIPEPVGLLYDTSNDVGKVHFGVVFFLGLPTNVGLEFHDPALADGHFEHATQLRQSSDCFENWSRIIIDKLL